MPEGVNLSKDIQMVYLIENRQTGQLFMNNLSRKGKVESLAKKLSIRSNKSIQFTAHLGWYHIPHKIHPKPGEGGLRRIKQGPFPGCTYAGIPPAIIR